MAFQKCPVCNGSGLIEVYNPYPNNTSISYNNTSSCPTCNGQRIISELNGLPPIINQPTKLKGYPSNPLEKYNYIKERLDTTGRASIRQDEFDFITEFEKKADETMKSNLEHIKSTSSFLKDLES